MACRSGSGAAAAAAAAAVAHPSIGPSVVILAAAVAGLAAGFSAAVVGVAVLWTWGRGKGEPVTSQVSGFLRERADSGGVVASAEKPDEEAWEEVNGNAPITAAADAAAETTTAAAMAAAVASAAVALSPAPVAPSAPEGSRRRLSMSTWDEADLTPPLPADVVRLLQASRLCFLSTFCDDHPHLSLMNFTYHPDDEVIILSTRRDTKKYKLVQTAQHVAILVHEFPDNGVSSADFNSVVSGAVKSSRDYSSSYTGSSGGSGTNDQGGSGTNDQGRSGTNDQGAVTPPAQKSSGKVTITLNGSASIQEGALAEKYRALHVKKNPHSKNFIIGPNIAIITVQVCTARICNVRDEVTFWDVANPSNAD